jgi:hypothetical protein
MYRRVSLEKILPAIEEKNYLAEHNMEWKDSNKTKTGPENSGLVKFFPNSNAIYLHDTPSKVYLAGGSRF